MLYKAILHLCYKKNSRYVNVNLTKPVQFLTSLEIVLECVRWILLMLSYTELSVISDELIALRFEQDDGFLKLIVTVDEIWFCLYEPETKDSRLYGKQ